MQSDISFSIPSSSSNAPRKVIEILDRTFRIYRANFFPLIALAAVFMVPVAVINGILTQNYYRDVQRSFFQNQYPSSYWVLLIVSVLGQYIVGLFVHTITTYIAAENHLGRKPAIMEAYRAIRPRQSTVAWGFFRFGFVVGLFFFLLAFIGALCFVGFFGLPIVGYLALAGFFFLTPVLVLEEVDAGLGINRALWLGKVQFWRTLGLYVLVTIILFFVGVLIGLLGQLFPTSTSTSPFNLTVSVAEVALQTIANVITAPIMIIAMTLMYFDTRVRVEGLDIALDSVDRPEPRVSDVASPQPQASLLTWSDVGNAVVLSIGIVALTFLLGATANTLMNRILGL